MKDCPDCAKLAVLNTKLSKTLGVTLGALQLLVEAADGHVTVEGVKKRVAVMHAEMKSIEAEVALL